MKLPLDELLELLKHSEKKCHFTMMVRIEKKYSAEVALHNANTIVKMCEMYNKLVIQSGKSWDIFKKKFLESQNEQ